MTNSAVDALAVSGTKLFAGTRGGVFLSTNNGTSWTPVNSGLPEYTTVNALVVSGTNLFAGTQGAGVFLSTNSGTSWIAVNSGLPTPGVQPTTSVWSLAVSGTYLFAGTQGSGLWSRPLNEMVASTLSIGNRIMAAVDSANVRNAQFADPPLFPQTRGVHGTIIGGPVTGAAGGYSGKWWEINWDSEPPDLNQQPGWCAESVISLAPTAGDVPQPNFSSSYYTSANIFWQDGNAPVSTNPPNPQLGSTLGNCTWYAHGRLRELGYNTTQLESLHGDASKWDNEALANSISVDGC